MRSRCKILRMIKETFCERAASQKVFLSSPVKTLRG
jgi:hypothetical protein